MPKHHKSEHARVSALEKRVGKVEKDVKGVKKKQATLASWVERNHAAMNESFAKLGISHRTRKAPKRRKKAAA